MDQRGSIPDADAGDEASELGDAARPVADHHDEPTQPAVGGQTAVQTPAEHRSVDVAAAQRYHNPAHHHDHTHA